MRELGRSAGSSAEMSDVYCGVSDFVDGGQHRDAGRDASAHDGGDFVRGLDVFAGLPVGGGTDAFGEGSKPVGDMSFLNALATKKAPRVFRTGAW
jgi:hypothetical protein